MKFKKRTVFLVGALCIALAGGGVLIVKNNTANNSMIEEQVKTKDIKTYYTFSGDVKAKKSQLVSLNSDTEIDEILVKEGDKVKNGDTLFKTSAGNKIKAEISGEVSEILVNEDIKYTTGTQLATIVNYDALQVEIKVDEYESDSIKIGDKVDVYINALDKTVEGKIVNLSKIANIENGISYFKGVVEIEDTADILIGMSVEVKAVKDDVKEVKTISMNALEFDSENQPYVHVKNSKGEIVEKSVTVGVNDGSVVEIKSGLKDSDVILYSDKQELLNPFEMMQNGGK